MPTKLEVRNVAKSFGHNGSQLTVLKNFSLVVDDLEFIVLLGPSGCGKSTLLRIIDGIESCDQGSILLNGVDVTGTSGVAAAWFSKLLSFYLGALSCRTLSLEWSCQAFQGLRGAKSLVITSAWLGFQASNIPILIS